MKPRRAPGPSSYLRLPVLVATIVLAAACQSTDGTTDPIVSTVVTTAPAVTATTTTTIEPPGDNPDQPRPDPGRTLRMGLLRGMSTDNYWKHICAGSLDVDGEVLGATRASLYSIAMPGINVVPDLAAAPYPPQPQRDGDVWVVEVPLRENAVWSDGKPITAGDLEFSFNVAKELGLLCLDTYGIVPAGSDRVGVLSVQVIDRHTVGITFNQDPGLGVWPYTVGLAPVMAEHFWAPHVESARTAGEVAVEAILDPAEAAGREYGKAIGQISDEDIDRYLTGVNGEAMAKAVFAVSGVGEPSGGPMIFAEWTPGLSVRNVANPRYYRSGEAIESGGVSYTMGPFIEEQVFTIYDTMEKLVSAAANGEVDHLMMPRSAPALLSLLESGSNTVTLANSSNGFWYLGFNLRKPPMNDPAFRRALAMMIDRDFLAADLFQDETKPAWTLLPEANLQYFDAAAAAEIASKYRNLNRFERLELAVGILQEAGYTWDREPSVGVGRRGEPLIEAGAGIMLPDGTPVPKLDILSPSPGSGLVFFAGYAVYIERWLQDLGFDARAHIADLDILAGQVWPGVGATPTFDMYLLGWLLGNPAFPTFHDSFFHSRNLAELNGGSNAVGYVNLELDQLTEQLWQVKTVEEAKEIIWQLETIIDRDLPYIVLSELKMQEVVSSRLGLPFTETLSGLLNSTDFPGLVRIRE